ncbi:MAG: cytochrome c [Candidatus Hydrogenedentales bacterium]
MTKHVLLGAACALGFTFSVAAQLPPDAVQLDKVKIPETITSEQFDPVTLEKADPSLATWEHDGVTYGSSDAGSKDKFMTAPDKFAERAAQKRWEANFIAAMSRIWCPVTDEINSGGGLIWHELDMEWESCCQFCNDTKSDEDFPRALKRLQTRAEQAYELTHGKYVNDASSPVEGAIAGLGGDTAGDETMEVAAAPAPHYLEGKELKATLGEGVGLVFEQRCVECHRPGGAAPMPFTSRGEIGSWTKNMKTAIESRTMPPWPASPDHHYANSKRLSDQERELLLEWIGAGYPPGEGEWKPAIGEWWIGEPDHVFDLEPHTLGEDVGENVREFTLKTEFDEDRYITAAEIMPTDTFLILEVDAGPLGSYHPGNSWTRTLDGTGFLLKKGAEVPIRIFYTKEAGWEETDDSTRIAVQFAENPGDIKHSLQKDRMANDDFTLAAGKADQEVTTEFTMPADGFLHAVTPVMRYRGKSVRYVAQLPGGEEKELLNIPAWDPLWHFTYQFAEPVEAPKGTKIVATAVYDNSEMNAQNPDATAEVKAGPAGELLEGWVTYSVNE